MSTFDPNTIASLKDFFRAAVLPAIALVATGAAKTLVSHMQNTKNVKRSVELTKRISELEVAISKLPKRDNSELEITPHMVLTDELKMTIAELKYIQTRVHYTFHQFCNDVSFKMRRAFVLYRPSGLVGHILHYSFYGYLVLALLFVGVMIDSSSTSSTTSAEQTASSGNKPADSSQVNPPQITTQAELAQTGGFVFNIVMFMLIFGVLSIPALILRFFSLRRIDRAGTAPPASENSAQAKSAAQTLPATISPQQVPTP